MSFRRLVLLVVALALPVSAGACGRGSTTQQAAPITQMSADVLPKTLQGLAVKRENVKAGITGVKRPYVLATGLYSLRKGKVLEATLQVSTFNDKARINDPEFRLAIVNQIGSTQPSAFRMGSSVVYLTTSKRQSVAVFFNRHSMGVLSTLDTFDEGRSLLRRVLELKL